LKEDEIFSAIDYRKDVDGFHPVNVGKLPPRPETALQALHARRCHELLIRTGVPLSGRRSRFSARQYRRQADGRHPPPEGQARDATVRSPFRGARTSRSIAPWQLVIAAMGQAHFVKADM